jgi:hypothetical protein
MHIGGFQMKDVQMNKKEHPVLAELRSKYNMFEFSFYTSGVNEEFSIFVVLSNSLKELSESWKKVVSNVAVNFQSQLSDKHKIWNIYIAFIIATDKRMEELKDIKYKIENDKYSSRKIVIDDISPPIDENKIKEKISKRIFQLDIDPDLPHIKLQQDLSRIIDKRLYAHISKVNLQGQKEAVLEKKAQIFSDIYKEYSHEI